MLKHFVFTLSVTHILLTLSRLSLIVVWDLNFRGGKSQCILKFSFQLLVIASETYSLFEFLFYLFLVSLVVKEWVLIYYFVLLIKLTLLDFVIIWVRKHGFWSTKSLPRHQSQMVDRSNGR